MKPQDVIVIGGGVAGLSAAHRLASQSRFPCSIRVLESSNRLGGRLDSVHLHGGTVDAAADGVLARRPELVSLLAELGHEGETMSIEASGASVYARGALRPLPRDLQLGIPLHWRSLLTSKTLSKRGLLRALMDVVVPRTVGRGHLQDRAIGSLVERKLGSEVVNTLVDPLLGGIVAGRVTDLSAQALLPPLLEAAQQPGSLMKAMRALRPAPSDGPPPPTFISVDGGMYRLIDMLREALDTFGVEQLRGASVTGVHRQEGSDPAWMVDTVTSTYRADYVIIATPAPQAAVLLGALDRELAEQLHSIDYASVAVVTLSLPEHGVTLPEYGTGILIPPASVIPAGHAKGERFFTTAVTFLDRKWPRLQQPGARWLRASVGRIDDERHIRMSDEELLAVVREELSLVLGPLEEPYASSVTRWDKALPQYRVNHQAKIATIMNAVARHDGLALAGAYLEGVGVPACIASGRHAAEGFFDKVGDEA